MFCSNCGKEISDGSAFCNNCGAQQTINNAENPQPQAALQTKPKSHSKAKLIWGIVLVALFGIGIFDAVVFKTGVFSELFKGDFSIENIIRLLIFIGFAVGGIYLITSSKKK